LIGSEDGSGLSCVSCRVAACVLFAV
jgi:hypothetical protein